MTYEEWKEYYGLVYEPNYSLATEFDCRAAFIAGAESRDAEIAELKDAAQAVIDRWDTPIWKDVPATGEYINKLRAALAKVRKP